MWWQYWRLSVSIGAGCQKLSKIVWRHLCLGGYFDKNYLWYRLMIGRSWVRISSNNGVKAMPGSIPAPNSGSFNDWKRKKKSVTKWVTPKNCLNKNNNNKIISFIERFGSNLIQVIENVRVVELNSIRFQHEFTALHCNFL